MMTDTEGNMNCGILRTATTATKTSPHCYDAYGNATVRLAKGQYYELVETYEIDELGDLWAKIRIGREYYEVMASDLGIAKRPRLPEMTVEESPIECPVCHGLKRCEPDCDRRS